MTKTMAEHWVQYSWPAVPYAIRPRSSPLSWLFWATRLADVVGASMPSQNLILRKASTSIGAGLPLDEELSTRKKVSSGGMDLYTTERIEDLPARRRPRTTTLASIEVLLSLTPFAGEAESGSEEGPTPVEDAAGIVWSYRKPSACSRFGVEERSSLSLTLSAVDVSDPQAKKFQKSKQK